MPVSSVKATTLHMMQQSLFGPIEGPDSKIKQVQLLSLRCANTACNLASKMRLRIFDGCNHISTDEPHKQEKLK